MKSKEAATNQIDTKNGGDENASELGYRENRRILIVEDEIEILKVYTEILSPKTNVSIIKSSRNQKSKKQIDNDLIDNFEVTTASNGEEALALVKISISENKPFAMGFFDVLLGSGIDGIETVRQIHELDSQMYSILVTAYQDRHVNSIQKIFGKKFQDRWDYLNKPFSEGEILQKARNMTSMWNIRKQKEEDQDKIKNLQQKIGENERLLTIAAVARGVGHEFGNILLQIMGRADLSRTGSPEEMKSGLETILTASEHAANVLTRFKNLASPSEQMVTMGKVSIIDIIKDTIMLMEHELKRCQVKTIFAFSEIPEIVGYRTGLVQVFMNLTINALHAIGDKSGRIEYAARVLGDQIEIAVRDSGTGISETHINSVFNTFFTTKGEKGTGLGLAICKEVIEITHGGKVSVKNHSGGGAEFCILLPINREGEI